MGTKCPDGIGHATHRSTSGRMYAKVICEADGIVQMKRWNEGGRLVTKFSLPSSQIKEDGSILGWIPIVEKPNAH